jgi:predicted Ser/Thr protein kinase
MGVNDILNANRVRHAKFGQMFMNAVGLKYKILSRLGGRRSADGIIFDIGKGRVLKLIFIGRGGADSVDQIKKEYKIGKMLSQGGVGPKVYGMKVVEIPNLLNIKNKDPSLWPTVNQVRSNAIRGALNAGYYHKQSEAARAFEQVFQGHQRAQTFNLFQNWYYNRNTNYNRVKKAVVIEMENLFKGPNVKECMSLHDYVEKKKNPFPAVQYKKAVEKMHKLGVAHGDMHANNVMVQVKKDGTVRVVMIDFGRSSLKGNRNYNGALAFNKMQKNMQLQRFGFTVSPIKSRTGLAARLTLPSGPGLVLAPGIATALSRPLGGPGLVLPPGIATALSQNMHALGGPASYGLHKAASGGYRIMGKRGPKKVTLTLAQLRQYAANKGAAVPLKWTKKQLLNFIYKVKGGVTLQSAPVASYGLVMKNGSVRMRGKRGLVKPTLTVAQLKNYAARKGINLAGAKLKKDILKRLAK